MHANIKALATAVKRAPSGRVEWYVRLRTADGKTRGWGGSRLTMEGARQSVADRLYRIDLGLV